MQPIQHSLTLFLIGATGDLAQKKIWPALYTLHRDQLLPTGFRLVGNSRKQMSSDEFRVFAHEVVKPTDEAQWQAFARCLEYVPGDVTDPVTFTALKQFHGTFGSCGNHLWYIATLPHLYLAAIQNIRAAQLDHTSCGWSKVMLEKPFGTDLQTARELDQTLTAVFSEDEIYRIDHFLAKETIQNLLVFRFANGIFEHLWNREYIDHIHILGLAESYGINGRGEFYDQTGTVRDVIQNHVLQMLAVTMMDEPQSLTPTDIRQSRHQILQHLRPFTSAAEIERNVRFGQYAAGSVDGEPAVGYLHESRIPAGSRTETAVAMRCFVDSPRWQGVPIYLRAGKRLARTVSEISIQFKEPVNRMFRGVAHAQKGNVLTLRVQPNEGVVVRLRVKKPGLGLELEDVPMQFCYKNEFQMGLVEAYVKLIYDAVQGDPTLFPRADGIEASWQYVQPLLDFKTKSGFAPELYPAGSWGPASFDGLMKEDDREWIEPSLDVCRI